VIKSPKFGRVRIHRKETITAAFSSGGSWAGAPNRIAWHVAERDARIASSSDPMGHMARFLKGLAGYDPGDLYPEDMGRVSRLLVQGSTSVVMEPSITIDDCKESLELVRSCAEGLAMEFDDLFQRIVRHTSLAQSLRGLRKEAENHSNKSFYRGIVDIHDCVRSLAPEDMEAAMAKAILCATQMLLPSMVRDDLYSLNKEMIEAGLRHWPSVKNRSEAEVVG